MKSRMITALFPGKFQPPHLGHIISIMSICDQYDKVIVAVTDDNPKILTLDKRVDIFSNYFVRFC